MIDQEAREDIKRLCERTQRIRDDVRDLWTTQETVKAILEYLGVEADYVPMTTGYYILVKKETKKEGDK